MSHACTRCGAALDLPTDLSVETFPCNYCGATQILADHLAPGVLAHREIKDVLVRTEEQSKRNTRAIVLLAGVLSVAIVAVLVVGSSRKAPAPSVATEPAPTEQQAKPAPTPTPQPTASATNTPPSLATLEKSFGERGSGPSQFTDARNIAVERAGNVWVTDKTGRVQRFSPEGALLGTIQASTTNKPAGPLSEDIERVLGVAVDSSDRVYVVIGYDIVRYSINDLTKPTATFRGQPHQTCYRDVSFDQAGSLYARSACTDKDVYALIKLNPSGGVLARFDEGPVWMKNATGRVAVDGTGQLWVPHLYESNIQVLDAKGKVVTRFGVEGDRPGEIPRSALREVALDGKGRVFVAAGDAVDVFEVTGRYVGRIALDYAKVGAPRDLAFAPDGALWVVGGKDVVLKYRLR